MMYMILLKLYVDVTTFFAPTPEVVPMAQCLNIQGGSGSGLGTLNRMLNRLENGLGPVLYNVSQVVVVLVAIVALFMLFTKRGREWLATLGAAALIIPGVIILLVLAGVVTTFANVYC